MQSNYPFKVLDIESAILHGYNSRVGTSFKKITSNWSNELHTEWNIRMYFACKMIYGTSLMLNSCYYAKKENLRIVEPYLAYFALFNSSRSLILCYPSPEGHLKSMLKISHKQVISRTHDILKSVDKSYALKYKKLMHKLKYYRELFSYKFPANGYKEYLIEGLNPLDASASFSTYICELAQITSEVLEKSFSKNKSNFEYQFQKVILAPLISEDSFFDKEDVYRINRHIRNNNRPLSVHSTMTTGMTEDFFGSWLDDDYDGFDPDNNFADVFTFYH